jgi:propanol-preferring alcohol dehydrogenase
MPAEYAAPLFCPGITAYKAVKAAEPQKNKRIAIFGIGGVGHMAIQFAKVEGCEVTGVSRKKKHLDVAEKLGAQKVFQFTESQDEFLNNVKNEYGMFDAAIVFAPSDLVTDTAIKSVKKGGTIVIATVGKIPNFLAFEEKTVRGTLIGSMKDMEKVIEIAQKNDFSVVTETFPLEEANEVLKKLKNSDIEARAVLIP